MKKRAKLPKMAIKVGADQLVTVRPAFNIITVKSVAYTMIPQAHKSTVPPSIKMAELPMINVQKKNNKAD